MKFVYHKEQGPLLIQEDQYSDYHESNGWYDTPEKFDSIPAQKEIVSEPESDFVLEIENVDSLESEPEVKAKKRGRPSQKDSE